jgi:hypothetical protein
LCKESISLGRQALPIELPGWLSRGVKLTTRSLADRPAKRRLGLESDRNHARSGAGSSPANLEENLLRLVG